MPRSQTDEVILAMTQISGFFADLAACAKDCGMEIVSLVRTSLYALPVTVVL